MKKRELNQRLTEADRRHLFERLGFRLNGDETSDGRVTGVLGPPELGEGENGNFALNLRTGWAKDFGSTGHNANLYDTVMAVRGVGFSEAKAWVAEQAGVTGTGSDATRRPAPPPQEPAEPDAEGVAREDVKAWCSALLDGEKGAQRRGREYLIEQRGIDPKLLRSRRVGLRFDKGLTWIVFPFATDGDRVTLAKERGFDPGALDWKRDDGGKPFMRTKGGGSCLVVMGNDEDARLLLCEGETDAFAARSNGFNAAFGSAGAGTFKREWAERIAGLNVEGVTVCYDGDDAGRAGAQKAANVLAGEGVNVRVADLPSGKDVNDLLQAEGGKERLREIIADATPPTGEDAPEPPAAPAESEASRDAAPVAGVLASEVEREPIRWIWKGRLARGEMTILDGDPGLGKSTALCDLAARLTTDRPLPGEDRPPRDGPGGVVLVTAEDSPSHTIRPRLDAAGADVGRVRIVPTVPTRGDDGSWDSGGERVPKLPDDLDVLKATCKDVGADLLVIDPLLAHLSGDVNSFKDGDVRSALAPVQAFAEEAGLALVVVRHLTKGSRGGNPLYRGQASIGIIGAARLALAFGKDPENEDQLVLAPNKINLGKRPPSLALRLEDSPDVDDVARVEWLGTSERSASELFSAGAGDASEQSPALSEAKDFLREELAEGSRPAAEMYDVAEEAGIAKDTLKRARREVATSERTGGVGEGGFWEWELKASEDALRMASNDNAILRNETGEKGPENGAKSAFEANWPKNGMGEETSGVSTKRGMAEKGPPAGIEEGGEAVHAATGRRVKVRKIRSRAVHITNADGRKMAVGPGDLKPVPPEEDSPANEVPF